MSRPPFAWRWDEGTIPDIFDKVCGVKKFFSFPNPVNDAAARTVALGVIALSVITFTTGWAWLLIVLTYGFLARVLAGPKISPLGPVRDARCGATTKELAEVGSRIA